MKKAPSRLELGTKVSKVLDESVLKGMKKEQPKAGHSSF